MNCDLGGDEAVLERVADGVVLDAGRQRAEQFEFGGLLGAVFRVVAAKVEAVAKVLDQRVHLGVVAERQERDDARQVRQDHVRRRPEQSSQIDQFPSFPSIFICVFQNHIQTSNRLVSRSQT